MHICYVDESGSADVFCRSNVSSTPLIVVAGLIVSSDASKQLVWDFLKLKKTFNSSLSDPRLQLSDLIAAETKGSDLRSDVRSGSRRRARRAFGIIEGVLELIESHNGRLIAHVLIKDENAPITMPVFIRELCATSRRVSMTLSSKKTKRAS